MTPQTNAYGQARDHTFMETAARYVAVVLRHKWLIVMGTVGSAVAAIGFSIVSLRLPPDRSPLPNTYTAAAVLLMQKDSSTDLDTALIAMKLTPTDAGASAGVDNAAVAMRVLRSHEILDTLAEEFGYASESADYKSPRSAARKAVLAGMSVDYDATTGALTLRFRSVDPQFSFNVVSRMVALLDDWFVTRGGTSRLRQKALLEQKLADVSVEISRLEGEVKDFQEKYGGLSIGEIAASQAKILDGLKAQLLSKEMEVQNYRRLVRVEDPNLLKMISERDNLKEQIGRIEAGYLDAAGTTMPAKQDLPELALRFDNLNRALGIQKGIYQTLAQQYEVLKLYLQSQPAFQVLEPPEVPDSKSGPSRAKICLAAILLGFAMTTALTLGIDWIGGLRKKSGTFRRLVGKAA